MIVKLTGEDLMLEDESRYDEEFDVHVDDDTTEPELAMIDMVFDQGGNGIELENIDVGWTTAMLRGQLIAMRDIAKTEREAMRKEIDL